VRAPRPASRGYCGGRASPLHTHRPSARPRGPLLDESAVARSDTPGPQPYEACAVGRHAERARSADPFEEHSCIAAVQGGQDNTARPLEAILEAAGGARQLGKHEAIRPGPDDLPHVCPLRQHCHGTRRQLHHRDRTRALAAVAFAVRRHILVLLAGRRSPIPTYGHVSGTRAAATRPRLSHMSHR
jgi:hypothetical protein